LLQGLYKFRFTTERGEGSGVMFATAGGRLYGGDSGSSFVGHFTEAEGVISAECVMSRHYHDPGYVPMFDVDNVAMNFTGVRRGEEVHFEGGSGALPGVRFTTVLSPIDDADAPPPGAVGPDGIGNGLYSIHIRMLDGIDAGNTGVMLTMSARTRRRTEDGKANSSIANIRRQRATDRCSAAMKSASAFPALTTAMARKAKPPRSPASAASASRRCCESSW